MDFKNELKPHPDILAKFQIFYASYKIEEAEVNETFGLKKSISMSHPFFKNQLLMKKYKILLFLN